MGSLLSRIIQSFLNIFGSKSKDLRLESPLPKADVETGAPQVRLPKPSILQSKKEWEKFIHQPTLTEENLNSSSNECRTVEIDYIDPNPSDIKYVLIALASFNWKMARMTPSQDSTGTYKIKFNNPTPDCIFKFVVNDQWMISDNYKIQTDEKGNQNNFI